MKGEEKLWGILNDKLETLRASNRLPEAIRIAETLLELAKRTFGEDDKALAISYEKLGTLLDQAGDRVKAKPYLLKAHAVLEKAKPPDQRLLYRSARRLAFLCDNLGQQDEAIRYYEKAIAAGTHLDDLPYADLGTMLNNVALIFRRSGRQKAAELYRASLKSWEEMTDQPPEDYEIVAANYADLLRSLGKARKAQQLEARARKRRRG